MAAATPADKPITITTFEDLAETLQSFQASITDIKKSVAEFGAEDNKTPEKKEASTKKAEMDNEKPKDKPMTAKMKAMYKAMDEKDPEKMKAGMKSAMDMKEEETEKSAEEDKEKTEMKAQIESLKGIVSLPKLTFLANSYKQTDITQAEFKELTAAWDEMSIKELDAEILKIKPFVAELKASITATPANNPTEQPATNSVPITNTKAIYEFGANVGSVDDDDTAKDSIEQFNAHLKDRNKPPTKLGGGQPYA